MENDNRHELDDIRPISLSTVSPPNSGHRNSIDVGRNKNFTHAQLSELDDDEGSIYPPRARNQNQIEDGAGRMLEFGQSQSRPSADGMSLNSSKQLKAIRNVEHVGFTEALIAEKPKKLTKAMCKLYFFLMVAFLTSIMNGYNGTVAGAISTNRYYQNYFKVGDTGSAAGVIVSSAVIGSMIGSFFCGPLTDWWGRRMGMFTGAVIIISGACIQGFAVSRHMFIAGRFLLGFGGAICTTAGPIYVAEMAHPAWRGEITGFYNAFFNVGGIPAQWLAYWADGINSNISWRLPVWLQVLTAGTLCISCFFIPETPRWLYSNGRPELAVRVLEKYHGEGNRKSPIVLLTYKELVEQVFINGSDKRWWDYSDLWSSRSAWWRNACVLGMAIGSQWAGNVAISYFLPTLLARIITKKRRWNLLYNGIMTILSFFASVLGACFVDRIGRRPILLGATSLFFFCWVFVTTFTGLYTNEEKTKNQHIAWAAVAFINIFQLAYSFAYTPLQILYPVECLAYEARAKGMGMYNLVVNLAVFLNMYGVPVFLERLKWRIYIIYAGWNVIQVTFIYFLFVETKGRTLEAINEIFQAPNPRKKSLEKQTLIVDEKKGTILYTGWAPNSSLHDPEQLGPM